MRVLLKDGRGMCCTPFLNHFETKTLHTTTCNVQSSNLWRSAHAACANQDVPKKMSWVSKKACKPCRNNNTSKLRLWFRVRPRRR